MVNNCEFAQVVFRFGESVSLGLTPIFAYFVVYLAYLEKYSQNSGNIRVTNAIKVQLPYNIVTFLVFLVLIVIWYIIGLPLGLNTGISL